MRKSKGKKDRLGLAGWLTILFIALKVTGYVSWSWWWVLSPLPIQLGLGLVAAFSALWEPKETGDSS